MSSADSNTRPTAGDLIVLTFEPPEGVSDLSPIKSKVVKVYENPEAAADLEIEIDDDQPNSQLYYYEWEEDGDPQTAVYRCDEFGGDYHIGVNAEIEVVA